MSIIQTRANETESDEPTNDRDSGTGNSSRDNANNSTRGDNSRDNNRDRNMARRNERVNQSGREACSLCDDTHPSANKEFVKCKKFLEMTPNQRGELVRRKHKCLQCLDGAARWNDEQHIRDCPAQWICPNESHARFDRKLHFLLCGHAGEEVNQALFERYKAEVLQAEWQRRVVRTLFVSRGAYHVDDAGQDHTDEICADFAAQLDEGFGAQSEMYSDEICADFSAELDLNELSELVYTEDVLQVTSESTSNIACVDTDIIPAVTDMAAIPGDEIPDAKCYGSPVFILQPIAFNNHVLNLMFDSGCESFVCRKGAVDLLPENCK